MSQQPYLQYPNAGPPPPAAVVPPPPSIVRATTLMFVQAGLSVVGLIVTVATIGTLRSKMQSRNTTLSAHAIDLTVDVSVAVAVVIGLASAVLFVLLALKMRAGRRWAWIVTLVLTILAVVSVPVSLLQNTVGISKILGGVAGLLDIALLVLILLPSSRAYVNRPRFLQY